ncbi:unnamed protein product, partial [marine sediment metagenome]
MNRLTKKIAVAVLIVAALCIGIAADFKAQAHPMFSALKVGQEVRTIQNPSGAWAIGVNVTRGDRMEVKAIGQDHVVLNEFRGNTFYIHVSQIA